MHPSLIPSSLPSETTSQTPSSEPTSIVNFLSAAETGQASVANTGGLIGAMAALLLVGGMLLRRCQVSQNQSLGPTEDAIILANFDPDSILAAVHYEENDEASGSHRPTAFKFGFSPFRMKRECRVGVQDTIPIIFQSDSFS